MIRVEQQKKSEQKVEAFWETQKPRVEKFIRYNYTDVNSITFTKITNSPLGTALHGFINNDKKLNFFVSVSLASGEIKFEDDISGALWEREKYNEVIPVSKIDEHEKQQEKASN
ncbi:DUF1433 domain-containing protein [Vagococcus entomophilus]|nr:DUF1433 domain-containing protein [Vagococcus entomophilus]